MKKILIANRGEIAIRVMSTAKRMGIGTVAVYSDADRNSPHVRFADEAIHIGASPSSDSYLRGDKIIAACKATGAEGIHPGYGFLSENAGFARDVSAAGLTLIGPSPEAMEVMGSKLAAKAAVSGYDIPMIEGTEGAVKDAAEAKEVAERIGFPVLIKASAGGGGKGMREVHQESELEDQFNRAVSEAINAFGDGSVFVEKLVARPRHIEVQIMADTHGNVVHLFERECSIQRRHQKVIEEAPSSLLTPEVRDAIGKSACDVARSCNYVGAGTVEFLADADLNYYFLEMNTRLQVEHPVTEYVTGKDLVEEQIRVARGEKLRFKQEDLRIIGHAIETRVYAEDPYNEFLPSTGSLDVYKTPQGPGVRVDNGYEQGMEIPIHYDPMMSKLVVHAETREEAIEKMKRAIDDYRIKGVATTLPFARYVMDSEAFRSGDFDTQFIKQHFSVEQLASYYEDDAVVAAFMAQALLGSADLQKDLPAGHSSWRSNRF